MGTLMVLLLVFSGNVFAASENDSQSGIDGVKNLLGIKTSQAVGVSYHTHVENVGWETYWANNEGKAGTQGQGLRLEGIEIKLTGDVPEGAKIEYLTHVQNLGWEKYWANNGGTAGTQGLSLRLEGIQIRLVNMPDYSIEYRTHVQNLGWETNWSKDGETAGTYGRNLRLEGIQIRIIKENADLTAYNKTLATANKAVKTNYTTYSWDNLQTVINNNVVNVKSSQENVDAATEAIETAYTALESVVNARVYSSAGTFGPASGLETISQDVVIKADGVILQNMHITGDLIISEEVGQGNATLNNITVDGETYVRGGGKNSIHINGGNYQRITIQETASGQVRIIATNASGLDVVIAEDAASEDVILEGGFDTVTVNATRMKISTRGATTIREMTVTKVGAGSQVTLDSLSRVERMVFNGKADIKGQGAIGNSQVNADNVTYEKAPEQQNVAKTVKVPPKALVVKVSVTGIALSGAGNVTTLTKAGTLQITAAVAPVNATNNKVTWSIVNGTGTASISNAGVVTGLTAGTVTVNATAQDGSGKVGTLTLTVTEVTAATIATAATINSSTVDPSFTITLTNDTFTDTANTLSNWTTAMGVTGLKVASITRYSNTQVIIGTTGTAAVGTITFKANAAALTKNLASNTVTVTVNPVMVSSIAVTGTGGATTLTKGSNLQMLATVLPANAVNKNLTWSVVNGTGSATISTTGYLTAVTAGTVSVKATAVDGSAIVGAITITIQEISQGVIASTTSVLKGASAPKIEVTLTNDSFSTNASSTILWIIDPGTTGLKIEGITRNSNTQVTITTSGTAAVGSLTIQAGAGAMTKKTASNTLTVAVIEPQVTAVTVTGSTTVGSTLTAAKVPTAATVSYQWQRADSATGTFTDIGSATAPTYTLVTDDLNKTIRVKITGTGSYGGSVMSTPSSLVISDLVTSITVTGTGNATTITTDNGKLQMLASVLPADAKNKSLKWSVTNASGSASIDASTGLLQAVSDGQVIVKAEALDSSGKFGILEITLSGQKSNDASLAAVIGKTITATGTGTAVGTPKTAAISVTNTTASLKASDITVTDTNAVATFYGTDSGFATIATGDITLTAGSGTVVYIKVVAADGTALYYAVTINRDAAPLPAQSGKPIIIGGDAAKFGSLLTAEVGTLGIKTNLSYKWYRYIDNVPGGGMVEVGSDATYTAVKEDIGKNLFVIATSSDATGTAYAVTAKWVAKAEPPAAPTGTIAGTYPVAGTSINLTGFANNASGLEAAVAIDGSIYGSYSDLTVDGSGNATITGLASVTTATKVKIRIKETDTTLAGVDKEITVIAAP